MRERALVMFDWDGVIVDSLDMFTTHFLAACHENGFTELGSSAEVLSLFDDNVYKAMEGLGINIETIRKILHSYEVRTKNHIDDLVLFEGMAEILEEIAIHNKIFIITSNVSSIPRKVILNNGIDCIEDVLGADHEKSKIKKIQNTIKLFPDYSAWYIGDTIGDIIEGKEAGAKTAGAAWGWHGPDKLQTAAPDCMVYSPGDLLDLFCRY